MKLSSGKTFILGPTGDAFLSQGLAVIQFTRSDVARLRRVLNACADVSLYLSRQRMKRAMKGDAS